MKTARNVRKRILVDRKLQLKIAALPVAALAMAGFILGVLTVLYCYAVPPAALQNPEARRAVVLLQLYVVASFVVLGAAMYFVSLYLSHKLAGPLYRISRVIEEVARGNFDVRVNLREGDEFQDLKEKVNRAIGRLQSTLEAPKSKKDSRTPARGFWSWQDDKEEEYL